MTTINTNLRIAFNDNVFGTYFALPVELAKVQLLARHTTPKSLVATIYSKSKSIVHQTPGGGFSHLKSDIVATAFLNSTTNECSIILFSKALTMLSILGIVLLWSTWFRTSQIASIVKANWMEV